MKEVRLSVNVDKTPEFVFEFVTNPKNTPSWIRSIVEEETNEWPIGIGTIYSNKSVDGDWSTYIVDEFKTNNYFTLTSEDGNYHVRYTVTPDGENSCTLEYYEWVDEGSLTEPLTIDVLEKLKKIIEKT